MNILLLSAGRRVELLFYLKKALQSNKVYGKVIAADITELAPAVHFADKFEKISRASEERYVEDLIRIIKKNAVSLVIPTVDKELIKLAENREIIQKKTGAVVLISDINSVRIADNKIKTYDFFTENEFSTPKIITEKELERKNYKLPLFIKPLNGSASINAFKVREQFELDFFRRYIKEPIIQEFIDGTEYTVDVMTDFEGNPLTIVPRIRLETRGGEISKGIVVKDREIIENIKNMIKKLKTRGPITVQCIKNNKGIYYIEINARFGGGAPISFRAGADSCDNLVKLMKGENLEYREDYLDNVIALRFDNTIFLSSETYERI